MKKIIPITSGFLLIALSVFSQAAEIELSLQHKNGGSLSDGTRMVDWPPESPDNQYHLNK
ncbi:TPA: hypothetical protein HMV62_23405 [Escherichia coli]|nr:hypothetical protein [Escherichia coli]